MALIVFVKSKYQKNIELDFENKIIGVQCAKIFRWYWTTRISKRVVIEEKWNLDDFERITTLMQFRSMQRSMRETRIWRPVWSSVFVAAKTSVRSPRKLFVSITNLNNLRVKVFQKENKITGLDLYVHKDTSGRGRNANTTTYDREAQILVFGSSVVQKHWTATVRDANGCWWILCDRCVIPK